MRCIQRRRPGVTSIFKENIKTAFSVTLKKQEKLFSISMMEDNFMIKSAVKNDAGILAELAIQMWHDNTVLDLEKGFKI